MKWLIVSLGIVILFTALFEYGQKNTASTQQTTVSTSVVSNSSTTTSIKAELTWPVADGRARITKKFFGTYVTPENSPVQPEKFRGYHTGIDFETTPDEQKTDVAVFAICNGPLIKKAFGTGYGGYLVQACTINKQKVTVIYGHLRLSSITSQTNQELKVGEKIGVLGTGFSPETDGERKHLHLGIHLGTSINIKGYVSDQRELMQWLDPLMVLP